MKKYSYLIALLAASIIVLPVFAQSTTPEEPEPTVKQAEPTESLDDEVDKLKEKVAETVSELKGKNEKAVSGVVKSVKDKEIVLMNGSDESTVTLDETLTKYYEIAGTATRDIKSEDIEENDYIFVLGPDINGEITANGIYKDKSYKLISGKITQANSSDFTINVISLDKINYTFDIQTRTNQQLLNIKTLEPEKIGFSKLKEGDSIHVVVVNNIEDPKSTRYDAERILVIPNEYFIQ